MSMPIQDGSIISAYKGANAPKKMQDHANKLQKFIEGISDPLTPEALQKNLYTSAAKHLYHLLSVSKHKTTVRNSQGYFPYEFNEKGNSILSDPDWDSKVLNKVLFSLAQLRNKNLPKGDMNQPYFKAALAINRIHKNKSPEVRKKAEDKCIAQLTSKEKIDDFNKALHATRHRPGAMERNKGFNNMMWAGQKNMP